MLVIRAKQMGVLQEVALNSFESEMLEHLADFSPSLFKAVGEEGMRETIRFGIAKAANYGFTFRGPVRFYLELMLLFGSYFDTDPQYPWANEILSNRDSDSQMQCADLLYDKTMDYRQKVFGQEDAYTLQALGEIALLAQHPLAISKDNFMQDMLREIERIYPQKAAYVGREGLEALIHNGFGVAKRQRFTTVRGVVLIILLMLFFGHGCSNDLLYPWIAKSLKDDGQTDTDAREMRLEKNALTWLEQVLALSGKEIQA